MRFYNRMRLGVALVLITGCFAPSCGVEVIDISAEYTPPSEEHGGPVLHPGIALPGVWVEAGPDGSPAYRAKFAAPGDGRAYHFSLPLPDKARIDSMHIRVKPRGQDEPSERALLVMVRVDNGTGDVTEIGHTEDPGGTDARDIVIAAQGEVIDLHQFNYRLDFVAATGGDVIDVISPPMVAFAP
jgi:hypothetical protein